MRLTAEIQKTMAQADPAQSCVVDQRRADQDLQQILSTSRASAPEPVRHGGLRRRSFRIAVAGAAITAAVIGTVVFGLGIGNSSTSAYAATPQPLRYARAADAAPAAVLLQQIEQQTTDGRPSSPSPAGVRIHWKSWSLFTREDTGGDAESTLVPQDYVVTAHADGTGTEQQTTQGRSETNPLGRSRMSGAVPGDPGEFRAWLQSRSNVSLSDPKGAAQAAGDLLQRQVLGPQQRAALLHVIGELPGLTFDGKVVDRAGRHGEAFSATSAGSGLPTRYTFIVDPASGQVLGIEETLTETAGKLNVKIPAVISYRTYLSATPAG
ncbi:hypothetical protein QFZ22_000615 [Streptomyces canus]|uniref:CU044_5270 family protein n=1 Tax=Streptomyces canus TaxID=58343 RepID=A0AAW8F5V0_9ACTN|nr:hypothetical protein [Streptomyces canus]MDQ0904630.1 hypothetical protein [Streptomyces canus]